MVTTTELIECKVCHKRFVRITHQHLAKHGLDYKSYKAKFPDARFNSPFLVSRINHSEKNKKRALTLRTRKYTLLRNFLIKKGGFATKKEVFQVGIGRQMLNRLLGQFNDIAAHRFRVLGNSDAGTVDTVSYTHLTLPTICSV